MKTYGTTYKLPVRGQLTDPRSTSGTPGQPRKALLNDRRSTR
jgi:hypothetical protein